MPVKIDITGHRGLTTGDRSKLLQVLADESPELLNRWTQLERHEAGVDDIYEEAMTFLRRYCIYETITDLGRAFVAMRDEVVAIGQAQGQGGN